MKKDTFKITVEFTVETGAIEPWDSEACAIDFVRHRIDEGYRLDEVIKTWRIMEVRKLE
jgi:hypothetical protein